MIYSPPSLTIKVKGTFFYVLRLSNTTYNLSSMITICSYPFGYESEHCHLILSTQRLASDLSHFIHFIIHFSYAGKGLIYGTIQN